MHRNEKEAEKELAKSIKRIKLVRQARNTILNSGAYSRRAQIQQLTQMRVHRAPQAEVDLVNRTWDVQHALEQKLEAETDILLKRLGSGTKKGVKKNGSDDKGKDVDDSVLSRLRQERMEAAASRGQQFNKRAVRRLL